MADHPIDARKERILHAIIDDYIQTASPVGSRTISRKYETSLSSATIRNEMSDLEELGYLAQPHVSAGRVPSVKAYRLYVDDLLSDHVPMPDASAREYFSRRVRQMEDVISTAAQAISEFTRYTAVVMMPKQTELRVSTLQLVPMPRGAALLVIITDTGAIRDTVIRVSEALDGDALYAISRTLTEHLAGRTLQEVQEMLGAYSRQMGNAQVIQGIADLAAQMERQSATDTLTVGGSHNILNYPEYSDVEKARAFLSMLEEKEKLMDLLSGDPAPFAVRIGPETGMPEMADCSVVTASYQVGAGHRGAVGVIGPTRMPYGRVLSALSAIGGALTELLGE